MLHSHLMALVLVGLTVVISGCGGSAKTGTSTSATLSTPSTSATSTAPASDSRAVFIAHAEPICARLNAQLDAANVKTQADLIRVLSQAAVYEQAELEELKKLTPPASIADDWRRMLAYTHVWSINSAKAGNAAKAKDFKASAALVSKTTAIEERLATVAKHSGFKQCGLL